MATREASILNNVQYTRNLYLFNLLLLTVFTWRGNAQDIPDIRLADGPYPNQGRVEIFIDGQWGTICKDYWDFEDVAVVCRQLGYTDASNGYYKYSDIPQNHNNRIVLYNVECTGDEESILFCDHLVIGSSLSNCYYPQAGAVCQSDEYPDYADQETSSISVIGIILLMIIVTCIPIVTVVGVFRFWRMRKRRRERALESSARPFQATPVQSSHVYGPVVTTEPQSAGLPLAAYPPATAPPAADMADGSLPYGTHMKNSPTTIPSASDLPPAPPQYNKVIENQSEFLLPHGQTLSPAVPPPEHV